MTFSYRALDDPEPFVREHAAGNAREFAQASPILIPHLAQALKDESECVRWLAAEALGNCGERATSSLTSIEAALRDKEPRVRVMAAWAITHISDELREDLAQDCVAVLVDGVSSGDTSSIRHACDALIQIGQRTQSAIPQLTKFSNDESRGPYARQVVRKCVEQLLRSDDFAARHESPPNRSALAPE